MKWDVVTLDNQSAGSIELDDMVFGAAVRTDILARVVNWQLAKRRAGTHRTKRRDEVAGSTRKIYRQKGTGQARHGPIRAPQFRGGGVVMGPVVRSHEHKLPKKVRNLGLRAALSSKLASGKLVILDTVAGKATKTRELAKHVAKFGWQSALVICGPEVDVGFARAVQNIPKLQVLPSQGANVYDILRLDTLALTREAVDKLVERLR
ncbi:MAG: 50S ribosomal protein L4 [Rhodospirillales bacterium]|nr:50S ribosomal protein L4 [Rhodospirillales bacterium]